MHIGFVSTKHRNMARIIERGKASKIEVAEVKRLAWIEANRRIGRRILLSGIEVVTLLNRLGSGIYPRRTKHTYTRKRKYTININNRSKQSINDDMTY